MPPLLWHPPIRILTYYLYQKSHNFQQTWIVVSHCAPSPDGDWWRKRGASYKKKKFSAEQKKVYIPFEMVFPLRSKKKKWK
jgi:hypothetical protein